MSSKRKGSPDVCVHDILAQFLSKELKDKCLSENEQTEEEEMSETLCSSDDETAVRNMKSKKKKKHKKHKSKKKKHDSGKEKNRSKKRRYQNYDSENEKRKVSKTSDMPRPKTRPKEEVLKQDDRNTSPEIKSQAVLKSCVSNISENSEPKDNDKCKNETEITSIQFPVTKMNFIEDVDCLDSVKNLVKLPKNCEVVLGSSVCSENELIEKLQNDEGTLRRKREMDNSALESKEEVCSHTKMTAFVTLQGEDNSAYNKIKEGKLDIIKTINSLNDKDSDDCVKLKQNDEKKQNIFNSLKYDDNKNVHQETISSMGTKNVISQQVTSKCQSNRDSDTTVHKVPTSFCTRDILLEKDGEERTVAGHFSIGSDKNLNEICLRPKDHKNSLNTKETGEISHESKRTCNEKEISLRKNSNKIKQECVRKPESVGENVNAKSVQQYTETNSNSSNSPDISVGEIENSDKEITLMNQFASFAPKIVDKPEPTEDKDCELNTLLPQSVNTGDSTVSSKKNFLSKSKILIKDLKCSLALQKAAENSQKKAELLEEGEITTSSGEEVKGDGEKSLESLGELNSDEGSGEVSTSDEERKHKKKKKKKHKHKRKRKEDNKYEKKLGIDTAENLGPLHHHRIADEIVHVSPRKRTVSLIQEICLHQEMKRFLISEKKLIKLDYWRWLVRMCLK
ncbi:uncharacterized protein LOC106474287 [Limulus polyphemus]|uniref:Uncharacterized protein LOC106474287 n=1 Tax=Limulus polyphemus TaxID=6850 RepID=A0ABM1BXA2_LIMPO|nr:uncharacterized protein LOC106474287 [Limulus polyphemus]XP_013790430.1 uncharacterized protein LOC106474287 [Limulus polyphemus]